MAARALRFQLHSKADTKLPTSPTSTVKAAVLLAVMAVAIAVLAGVARAEDAAVTVADVDVARAGNADTR
jgi:hypothetical protein